MPNQQSLTEYVTRLIQLEQENRSLKTQLDQKFGCFKCGDGATPLYCLNCAIEENNKSILARLDEARWLLNITKGFGTHSANNEWIKRRDDWLKGTP